MTFFPLSNPPPSTGAQSEKCNLHPLTTRPPLALATPPHSSSESVSSLFVDCEEVALGFDYVSLSSHPQKVCLVCDRKDRTGGGRNLEGRNIYLTKPAQYWTTSPQEKATELIQRKLTSLTARHSATRVWVSDKKLRPKILRSSQRTHPPWCHQKNLSH